MLNLPKLRPWLGLCPPLSSFLSVVLRNFNIPRSSFTCLEYVFFDSPWFFSDGFHSRLPGLSGHSDELLDPGIPNITALGCFFE